MGSTLTEFKKFLQSILDFHAKNIGDSPDRSMAQKSEELQTFTEDYNMRAIDRAVEILADRSLGVDKGKLSIELAAIIKLYSKKFLNAHFKKG